MYDRPMDVFEPRASLRNAHRMTLYSWGNPRHFPRLPAPTRRYFDVAPATRVVADCHWHERPWEHVTLVALHGLNGSSEAHYMRGLAAKGFARGGNLALKLAGEYGAFAPKTVLGVAAVSPIIEISECTRALERPGNALYQWNFVRDLKRRMRRKERFHSGRFDLTKLNAVRTVREFDETYTAPYFGFRNAEDYYHRASSMRVIDRIRVPALIITAEDDPFVPSRPFHDPKVTGNPHIDLRVSPHGGHCGFVGARSGEDDGYWAENRIVEFIWGLGTGDGLPGTGTRHLLRVHTDSPRFQNVEGDPFRFVVRRG